MISNPRLYAVMPKTPAPAATHKLNLVEHRRERDAGLELKRDIDRAAALLDSLDARVASIDQQIKALQRSKQSACARIEHITDEILARMEAAHLKRADGYRRAFSSRVGPPAVDVQNETLVPEEYWREKIVRSLDKTAIKAILTGRRDVPGCTLTQKLVLQRE